MFLVQPSYRLGGIVSWPLARLNPVAGGAITRTLFTLRCYPAPCSLSRNYFSLQTGETRTVSEIGQTSVLTKYKLLDRK